MTRQIQIRAACSSNSAHTYLRIPQLRIEESSTSKTTLKLLFIIYSRNHPTSSAATKGNTEHKIQDTTHWMIHHKPTPWEVLSLWRRVRLLSVARPRIRRRRRLARNYLLIDVIAMFCIILRVWFVRRVVCPPSKGIFDRQSLAVAI